eukprot:sb/3466957/
MSDHETPDDTAAAAALAMPTEEDLKASTDLRIKYSLMQMSLHERRSELVRPDSTGLLEIIQDLNTMYTNVTTPREAAFDSECLMFVAELANEKAQNLQTDLHEFDRTFFASELAKRMTNEAGEVVWSKLGVVATNVFNAPAKLDLIYGPLATEPEIKKRAARQRNVQKRPEESAKKKPVLIEKQEQEEATTKEVKRVMKSVHRLTGAPNSPYPHVPFFELIIHPTSFSTTVENLFHLSFLVKDGRVKLFLDDDNIPVVKFGKKDPSNGGGGGDIPATPGTTRAIHPSQVVVSMSMEKWRSLIRELGITKPLMDEC